MTDMQPQDLAGLNQALAMRFYGIFHQHRDSHWTDASRDRSDERCYGRDGREVHVAGEAIARDRRDDAVRGEPCRDVAVLRAVSLAKAATVQVGQPLTMTRDILGTKVVAVITVANVRPVKASNQFQKPAKGQFLAADVAVTVQEGKFTLTQGSLKVVAADGTVYDSTLPAVEPALGFTELTAGQKTSGAVTFDTAPGAEKGGRIALSDVFADGDAGYWQLP